MKFSVHSWQMRHYLMALVLATAAPLFGLMVYAMQANHAATLREAGGNLTHLAEITATDTARYISHASQFLGGLAQREPIRRLDPHDCDPLLLEIKPLFSEFANVASINAQGQMVCSARRPQAVVLPSFANFPWFQAARQHNGFMISDVHLGPVSKRWVVAITTAIQDDAGGFLGIVGYSLDLEKHPLLTASGELPHRQLSLTVVDQAGHVLLKAPHSKEQIGSAHHWAGLLPATRRAENQRLLTAAADLPGNHQAGDLLTAYAPIPGTALGVYAVLPASEVLDELLAEAYRQYLLAAGLILLGALLTLVVAKRLLRPVHSVSQTAAAVAAGDLQGRAVASGPAELVQVVTQFNQMLDVRLSTEARYQNLFESANDAILVINERGVICLANSRAHQLFGYAPNALVHCQLAQLLPDQVREGHHLQMALYLQQPTPRTIGKYVEGQRQDGSRFPCSVSLSPLETPEGLVISTLVRDLSEFTRLEAQIDYLARHDALTGLPNRQLLNDRLETALARARQGSTALAVVHLDIDQFSSLNDFHGIAVGDEALRCCADCIRNTMGDADTAVRAGSDEFIVILEGNNGQLLAERFVEAMQQQLPHTFARRPDIGHLTASFGVATYPEASDTASLLKNADLALISARKEGGNSCRFFDHDMDALARRRLQLLKFLHGALARDEFHLVYQPQVAADTGQLIGAEALLRWQSPELGPVSPAEFIPLAEMSGEIEAIGAWVLRTACQQMADWNLAYGQALRVAVNLSARQFRNETLLLGHIASSLKDSGLPAALLEAEITEGMLMEDPEHATATLHQMAAGGIRIAIDDFGTGYSSLAYLRRFRVHVLKIDQSFVRELESHRDDQHIVSAVISLAASLELEVVAEGVETPSQFAFLRQKQCPSCQGYWFSRPLPAARFAELLAQPDWPWQAQILAVAAEPLKVLPSAAE